MIRRTFLQVSAMFATVKAWSPGVEPVPCEVIDVTDYGFPQCEAEGCCCYSHESITVSANDCTDSSMSMKCPFCGEDTEIELRVGTQTVCCGKQVTLDECGGWWMIGYTSADYRTPNTST